MADTPLLEGFDPADFRTNIRATMVMGLPPVLADQPQFIFATVPNTVSGVPADSEHVPFDLTQTVGSSTPTPVRVPCAVEFSDEVAEFTNAGVAVPARVKLTFLDVDYELVRGYKLVKIGGVEYAYSHSENPIGLGTVGVFTDHCVAGINLPG